MKKMMSLLALSLLLGTGQAYADIDGLETEDLLISQSVDKVEKDPQKSKRLKKDKKGKRKGIKACKRVQLTKAQRKEIRALRQEFKLKAVDLKADVKKARLKYRFAVIDKETTKDMALGASDEIAQAKLELIKERLALKNEIMFEVLEPKQRRPMLKCMKQRRMKRQAKLQIQI